MRPDPRITVVIPTHNRSALLAHAIESILQSDLAPSPATILVADDDSSDDTAEVSDRAGTRYVRLKCGNPGGTRNAALKHVETPFVAFLDDDDLWLKPGVAPQLAAIEARPDAGFAFGRSQMTTEDLVDTGEPIPHLPLPRNSSELMLRPPQVGAVVLRAEALRAVRGFDERLRWGEDSDLFVRMAARYPVVPVDQVTAIYRRRPPTGYDARIRRRAERDLRTMRRSWARQGIHISRAALFEKDRELKGMWVFEYSRDARALHALGEDRMAAKLLAHAAVVSPLHALRPRSEFWGGLLDLMLHRQPPAHREDLKAGVRGA